jgi:hypothetical protein
MICSLRKLLRKMSWLTYEFSERISWYVRMACVALLILTMFLFVASCWYNFYNMVALSERHFLVPRTND